MRTIVLVLTVSNVLPPGEKLPVPTDRGKRRLDKAGELMAKNPNWELAIVGGNRPKTEDTEAHAARRYLKDQYPGIEPDFLLHAYNNTAENVFDFIRTLNPDKGEKELSIVLVGNPEHSLQAAVTIYELLPNAMLTFVPAGDEHQYAKWKRSLLMIATVLDPLWVSH